LGPPPRALAISGWALLPLRAFLGFTFCFAGLQKLANPNFFNANSPSSIQAQMIAAARISPLHSLMGHLLRFSVPIGIVIALAEVAVGLGTLLGLWSRIAALGGVILSFTLFLSVSFHASPYFTGADIVFFFAWIPLVLAGAGGVLSLDTVIDSWTHHEARLAPPALVPVRFALVQQVCGHFDRGRCTARQGAICDVGPCPFLREHVPDPVSDKTAQVDRRALVLGGAAAGATAVVALVGAGTAAGLGRAIGLAKPPSSSGTVSLSPPPPGARSVTRATNPAASSPPSTQAPASSTSAPTGPATTVPPATSPPSPTSPPSTTPTTTAPAHSGTAIGPAADVPVGGAARFQDPASGDPGIVLQTSSGRFVAFDAVCPHAGCTVGYSPGADLLVCPCHGSEFNASSGAVETGPAATGLRSIPIARGSDGQLYADG
jgi:thiosulfate dehydrogenase (quinone) large subunit